MHRTLRKLTMGTDRHAFTLCVHIKHLIQTRYSNLELDPCPEHEFRQSKTQQRIPKIQSLMPVRYSYYLSINQKAHLLFVFVVYLTTLFSISDYIASSSIQS
jgi:hypothetical protein